MRRIAPYVLAVEKQARTVEVEVEFDQPGEAKHLLVGYSADIEIVLNGHDDVVRVPTPALMPGNRVLVLGAGGVLEERKIQMGLSNWEFTEAKSGLNKGDRVVTSLEREGVKAGARATTEGPATGKRKPPRPRRNDRSQRASRALFWSGAKKFTPCAPWIWRSPTVTICRSWGLRDRANRRCSISSVCSIGPTRGTYELDSRNVTALSDDELARVRREKSVSCSSFSPGAAPDGAAEYRAAHGSGGDRPG